MKNKVFKFLLFSSLVTIISCQKEDTLTNNNPSEVNFKIKSIQEGSSTFTCSYNSEGLLASAVLSDGSSETTTFNFVWSPTSLTIEQPIIDSTGQTSNVTVAFYTRNNSGYVLSDSSAGWVWIYNNSNQATTVIESGTNFTDITWLNGNYTATTTSGSIGSIITNYSYSSEIETRDAGGKYFPPLTGNILSMFCFPNKNLLSSKTSSNGSGEEFSYQKDSKGRIISESRSSGGNTTYTYFD